MQLYDDFRKYKSSPTVFFFFYPFTKNDIYPNSSHGFNNRLRHKQLKLSAISQKNNLKK